MRHVYLVLVLFLLATVARAESLSVEGASVLKCGRENPMGDGAPQTGIGHAPMKVTSKGLMVTFRYFAREGRREREYLYRIREAGNRSVSLVRVDSQGQDKAENTATLSFNPDVVQKSEGARNTSMEWVDTAPTKPPLTAHSPGKTWFFCTNIDLFLQDVRDRLRVDQARASFGD
jgi:hypothetical protein